MNKISITEKEFRQQVIDLAKLLGYRVYFTWTSIHSPRGMLDLILCHANSRRLIFAELKSETGKVSSYQQDWIDDLSCIPGVEVYVWRPGDIENIVNILRGNNS